MVKPKVKLERKKAHVVYKKKDGTRVPGASTICKIGDSSEGLINWAWNLGIEGKDYKAFREEACDAGNVAHFLIECYLKEQEADLSEFSPDVINLAETVFIKFLDFWQSEGMRYIESESVYVSELGYGGTLDILAVDRSERYCLLDTKSSKRIYDSNFYQLAGYENLLKENGWDIQRRAILRLGKKEKGDFEVRWLPETDRFFNVFKAQLALYQALKQ